MGMLVAIEGIDGAGKGTQAALLEARLHNDDRKATVISFPRYKDTMFGKLVGQYLDGQFGSLEQTSPFLTALLYAGDRFESRSFLREAIANHDVVILDRYVYSNIAHQVGKISNSFIGPGQELMDMIMRLEFGLYIMPVPQWTYLLDVSLETSKQLIAQKEKIKRGYTEKPADLHEIDTEYLGRVKAIYALLVNSSRAGSVTVKCDPEGKLRTRTSIADEIYFDVKKRLAAFEE